MGAAVVKPMMASELTDISFKALQAPWVGTSAGWSPRCPRAQQHFSFHFTMAEASSAPLPPRPSNFQQQVECMRDATVNPDEEAVTFPGPAVSSYYCRHASLPHNQLSNHRMHDAACRDELQAAHTDKAARNCRSMYEQERHSQHPGMARFINAPAMRSPLRSVSRRVGLPGPEVAPLCKWANGQQWLDHTGSYCTETKYNTLVGVVDTRHQLQQEADEAWISQSEKLHGCSAQRTA